MAPTTASLLDLALAAFHSAKTPAPFNPGFNISAVYEVAKALPSHSWEFGAATQALLEYESPLLSVYGPNPFPVRKHDPATVPALAYAQEKIVVGTGIDGLSPSAGAVGDPASLVVGAWMLGKTNETFATATKSEVDYVLNDAPRYANGAISQRGDVGELWADYVWMFPPSLAFYAADIGDVDLLELAYRDHL
ncbi:hypothetical protein MKEN_01136000 [Mycena kentingensis (nom. inval.)]|nr:hypothetical protein MKEN_01136000 [Mycena kentingensis (nom. inval.)]